MVIRFLKTNLFQQKKKLIKTNFVYFTSLPKFDSLIYMSEIEKVGGLNKEHHI